MQGASARLPLALLLALDSDFVLSRLSRKGEPAHVPCGRQLAVLPTLIVDMLDLPGLMEYLHVEESQAADRLIEQRPRQTPLGEMKQVGANLLPAHLLSRLAVKGDEPPNRLHVGLDGGLAVTAQVHLFSHSLPHLSHHSPPFENEISKDATAMARWHSRYAASSLTEEAHHGPAGHQDLQPCFGRNC